MAEEKDTKPKKLTAREGRYVYEFCISGNKTQAAIKAGYSEKSAKEIGYKLFTKVHLRAAIDSRLKELSLTAAETTKLISDIAKSSLNDYFIVKDAARTPKVKKTLPEVISDLEAEIEDGEKFISMDKIESGDYLNALKNNLEAKRFEIIRMQIELERNPDAWRMVDGTPEIVKVADFDLAKLVQDKEAGRIKSVKYTEFGLAVEMYPADAALRDIARMHGLFEKDNEQAAPTATIINNFQIRKRAPLPPTE